MSAEDLPNRLPPQQASGDAFGRQEHTREPERLLVEVTATDGESASDAKRGNRIWLETAADR